jgi:hypothetical protein
MKLCDNCLEPGDPEAARPIEDVPVGHALGSQRDPEQRTIALCGLCAGALCAGDLATLVERHSNERTVRRDA